MFKDFYVSYKPCPAEADGPSAAHTRFELHR